MLSYWKPAVDALSVTPGHLLPPSLRIWTLLTSPFLEIHLWEVCVDIITVGLCGKYTFQFALLFLHVLII